MPNAFDLDDYTKSLEAEIRQIRPDLAIDLLKPLVGGLSGASVLLAEFLRDGERRLGVVKVASPSQAKKEELGDQLARTSWLKDFLPDFLDILGSAGGNNNVAVLSTLARDRLVDCRTLADSLKDSFPYAKDHVLFAVAHAYRQEAARCWTSAVPQSIKTCFRTLLFDQLGENWQDNWNDAGLPPAHSAAFVFDETDERWPNPVAFLVNDNLWPSSTPDVRVPSIHSHGDLNPRNILCMSYQRSVSQRLLPPQPEPNTTIRHVSLIDMPFCRQATYPFDLTFLISGLRLLLPTFDSQVNRDAVIGAYRAAIDSLTSGQESQDVPARCTQFTQCCFMIWQQLKYAQPHLAEEIELGTLACLSAAALWQAVKAVNRKNPEDRDRATAVSTVCLSALALKALIRNMGTMRLPGDDYKLWADPRSPRAHTWTNSSKSIAQRLAAVAEQGTIILALGREWASFLGQPSEGVLRDLRTQSPNAILGVLEQRPSEPVSVGLAAIGRLPISAVLDWSLLRFPRDAIALGIQAPRFIQRVLPGKSTTDWANRHALFYFHWRGTFEDFESGIGLTVPERNRLRGTLREDLLRLSKKRSQNQTLVYVGVGPSDVREMHEDLQQVWKHKLKAIFIGTVSADHEEYFREWDIERVPGSLADFTAAVAGFRSSDSDAAMHRAPADGVAIRVADITLDQHGELIAAPGETARLTIPDSDYQAINRAGHLFVEQDMHSDRAFTREPRDFFIGHRIEFDHIRDGVPVERERFAEFRAIVLDKLGDKRRQVIALSARPGAGATTALRCIAHELAVANHIPTLVLSVGGNQAYEAIERLYQLVGRSFLVVADAQDVLPDDLSGLVTRCGPPRYPVVFLTSVRVLQPPKDKSLPLLDIKLTDLEKAGLVERLGRYCLGVPVGELSRSSESSLFFLNLMAFGGEHLNVNAFVATIMDSATELQRFLLAVTAFFSRYGHRTCSDDFLELFVEGNQSDLAELLDPFDSLLVLHEDGEWICRHDQLSGRILQFYLTQGFTEQWRYRLAEFTSDVFRVLDGLSPGETWRPTTSGQS